MQKPQYQKPLMNEKGEKTGQIAIKAEDVTDGNTELVIKASAQLTSMRKWYICGDCDWPYLLIEKATKPPGGLED